LLNSGKIKEYFIEKKIFLVEDNKVEKVKKYSRSVIKNE